MWRSLSAKIVIKVTGPESDMACQDGQVRARLKALIDGALHRVQAIWGEKLTTEDWVFILVDEKCVQLDQLSWNAVKRLSFMAIPKLLCYKLLLSLVIDCFAEWEWDIQIYA